jgi:hypothetical protein
MPGNDRWDLTRHLKGFNEEAFAALGAIAPRSNKKYQNTSTMLREFGFIKQSVRRRYLRKRHGR